VAGAAPYAIGQGTADPTTTACRITVTNNADTAADIEMISLAFFGDQ